MAAVGVAPIKNWESAQIRLTLERKKTSNCLAHPDTCAQSVRKWQKKIVAWRKLNAGEQIAAVNRFANRTIRYTDDRKTFKKSDYWATPLQSLRGRGDCEDYVLLKYESLLALGFAKNDLRIVVVMDQRKNLAHAVLSVKTAAGTFILDNQDQRVLSHDSIRHYAPLYSINEKGRWVNFATRQLKKQKAPPMVLVAGNAELNDVAPALRVTKINIEPVFKPTASAKPVVAWSLKPRLQATASLSLLRTSISVAERKPEALAPPPTFLQRWATVFEPLLKFVRQSNV